VGRARRSLINREVQNLRRSMIGLDRSLRRRASMLSQLDGRIERRRKPRTRSGKPLSPKARASLVLQGRYMGYIRQLTPEAEGAGQEGQRGEGNEGGRKAGNGTCSGLGARFEIATRPRKRAT
jgi:hypothetical protein